MKKYVIILAVAAIFIFVIINVFYRVRKEANKFSLAFVESDGVSSAISARYFSLFAEKERGNFKNIFTVLSKKRNPVSSMTYDSMYCIIVYQIDLMRRISMGKFIKEEKIADKGKFEEIYIANNHPLFNLEFKTGIVPPVAGIYLSFPDSIKALIKPSHKCSPRLM